MVNLCAYAQIDENLNTISLKRIPHFTDTVIESGDFEIENARGKESIRLFKTLYIQKHQGVWLYDTDSCCIKRVKAAKMAYFPNGTQAIFCGLSWDAGVKVRKTLRSASYPILEDLEIGDTLRFTLTTLAYTDSEFQPEIYTSNKLKVSKGLLKNGKYLNYCGQVPKASLNDEDLVQNTIEIPITKDNRNIRWVHVVNHEEGRQKGFIIENECVVSGTEEEDYALVYFRTDSYELSSESIQVLDGIASGLKESSSIILRGYADTYGQKDYNIQLAKKRAEEVMNYFLSKGVSESRIKIEEFDIGKNKTAKENRICTILVL